MALYRWAPMKSFLPLLRCPTSILSVSINRFVFHHYLAFDFPSHLDAPVKWSEHTALSDSLPQCWFLWEKIQNNMSSQATACSQAPSYSLSTQWHALLWTEVCVTGSSSTLLGRYAALQSITYNSVHKGEIVEEWTFNAGVMFQPIQAVDENPLILFCHAENTMILRHMQ